MRTLSTYTVSYATTKILADVMDRREITINQRHVGYSLDTDPSGSLFSCHISDKNIYINAISADTVSIEWRFGFDIEVKLNIYYTHGTKVSYDIQVYYPQIIANPKARSIWDLLKK